MKPPIDILDDFPPFEGFPREGITFLRSLKRHNDRAWFAAHKQEYEESVKLPMQSLIVALRPHLQRFAPEFDAHPRRSLFRIYRDTRFSKDKTPYKTHVAAHFVLRGTEKGLVGSGFYLHIEPGECYIGSGIYMPDGSQLKRIRSAVSAQGKEFLSIVRAKAFVRSYGSIQGESLTRMPKGFSDGDPMAEWLKLKQFFIGTSLPESACRTRAFVRTAAAHFETATPFLRFLNAACA